MAKQRYIVILLVFAFLFVIPIVHATEANARAVFNVDAPGLSTFSYASYKLALQKAKQDVFEDAQYIQKEMTTSDEIYDVGFDLPDVTKASVLFERLTHYWQGALNSHYQQLNKELEKELKNLFVRQRQLEEEVVIPKVVNSMTHQTEEQLDTIVDLSALRPEMSASEAFEVIRTAVDPPLNIAIMWKDLLDNAEIEPVTMIDLDGLPTVRLGTALDALCGALGGGFYPIAFKIKDGLIFVATRETLDEMVFSEHDAVSVKPSLLSQSQLEERYLDLDREHDHLMIELSVEEARLKAAMDKIQTIKKEINERVDRHEHELDLRDLVQALEQHQELVKRRIEAGTTSKDSLIETMEKLSLAKQRIADQRISVTENYGGKILVQLNEMVADLTVSLAGERAKLAAIKKQLREMELQIEKAPEAEIQQKKRLLKMKELELVLKKVSDIQQKLESLKPPTVTLMK